MHIFAFLTAVATFILLIAGGLVTSTDSGLAVPDWPLSYGTLFPPMVGGIVYEHTHRVIAATVGLLIVILAVWVHRREPRRWVRWLSLLAVGAVVAQGLLGGLTVLLVLPAPISIAHACLGQFVWCLVLAIALATSPAWRTRVSAPPEFHRRCRWMTAALVAQLVLGAVIRHSGRALLWHIGWALILPVLAGSLVMALLKQRSRLMPAALVLVCGLVGQIALGMVTLLWEQPAVIATAHVAAGAALLGCAWTLTLWTWASTSN